MGDDGLDGGVVLLVVDAAFRVAGDVLVGVECRAHVVVGRQRVTAGDGHLRAAVGERLDEDGSLRLDVHRHRDAFALEGLVVDELLADDLEDRHVLGGPLHLAPALLLCGLEVVQLIADRRVRVGHASTDGDRSQNGTEADAATTRRRLCDALGRLAKPIDGESVDKPIEWYASETPKYQMREAVEAFHRKRWLHRADRKSELGNTPESGTSGYCSHFSLSQPPIPSGRYINNRMSNTRR